MTPVLSPLEPLDASGEVPQAIVVARSVTPLERLAALEVRRYSYLRSGKLLPIENNSSGPAIVIQVAGPEGGQPEPQGFEITTLTNGWAPTWCITGGDPVGVLYGAYRFAEHLGVRFSIAGDVLPDEKLTGDWPVINETGKPRFALRGLQPFHDFSTGPDWWNAHDYKSVLSQMAKLRLNFIGLHTYPSWNPAAGPEANVWIGLPEDVTPQGDVLFGYEAGVVTTRRGWAVNPFPTSRYASGAGLLFEADDFGPDFMLDSLEWPKSPGAQATMFNLCGSFQKEVFTHGRALGIKSCLGTELPLGIPPALASRLRSAGLNPSGDATIQRLYEGTFLRLTRKLPLDYYWLWTPEVWLSMEPGCKNWEMTSRENTERNLKIAEKAYNSEKRSFGMATSGWRLGTREDPLWLHKRTPTNWAVSSINTSLGRDPVEAAYGQMTNRSRWAIAWAEDDDTAGAHCCTTWDVQLWPERILQNAAQAQKLGCEGFMAIHWRTAAISPNIEALAQSTWDIRSAGANSPASAGPTAEEFWLAWAEANFGKTVAPQIAAAFRRVDGSHLAINGLIAAGGMASDAQIADVFAPLRQLEGLRSSIAGKGNIQRLDYWIDLLRATELRVKVWRLSARFGTLIKAAEDLGTAPGQPGASHVSALIGERIELARAYEEMIAALVRCASSPGELGTISSIESGSRARIVEAYDAKLRVMAGDGPLPADTGVSPLYSGTPRLFVSSAPDHIEPGKPCELRIYVLSSVSARAVTLHWRPLGKTGFKQVPALHRSRTAYRVSLPPMKEGGIEYYIEAMLENGEKATWPATAPVSPQSAIVWSSEK